MADAGVLPKPTDTKSVKTKPLTLGQATARTDEATNEAEQSNVQTADSVNKLIADHHSEMQSLLAQAPKPPSADDKFKAPEQVNPVSAFGSSAGLLATLLGAFSRAPLTTSLKAMTAGMNAIQQGNAEAYTRAHDEWKENTDYAFKVLDAENKHYDRLISFAKDDYDSALQGIQTTAKARNDNVMLEAARMKGLEGVEQVNIERARLGMEMKTNAAKMIPGQIFNTALKDFVGRQHRQPTAQEMGKMWQDTQMMSSGSSMTPETMRMLAKRYVAGDKTALSGLGFGSSGAMNRAMVQNFITEEMQDQGKSPKDIMLAQAEFAGLQSKERALGTQEARVGTAVDELTRVVPLALSASAEVARTNLVPWNNVRQAIQHGTSDPKLARLVAATQTLINVYARSTNPLGVARVSDKEHARDMLAETDGAQAYAAVVDQMQKEAEAAGMSPNDVKNITAGEFLGTPGVRSPASKDDVYLPESADDYAALPKGAKFRKPGDPMNSFRTKD